VEEDAVRIRGVWTCQRTKDGVKCGHKNPSRYQLCRKCAKRRPPRKRPAHLKALDIGYDQYVAINGGEHCGICGATAKARRLHRDHEHSGDGRPRGILCFRCNAALRPYMDAEWLDRAAAYLRRAA